MDAYVEGMMVQALEASLWLSLFAAPWGALLIFRRLSFFGDALSHSTVAGLALVLMFIGENPFWLSLGALASVLVTSGLLHFLERKTKLSADLALTVSYSGMFALGMILIGGDHEHLEHVLIGDIWKVNESLLWFMRLWGSLIILILAWFWRPLWASVMEGRFAQGLGYRAQLIDFVFLAVTSISVVGIIQSVGVILVAAYLVLPAATALPWARSLLALVGLSTCFALLSSLGGVFWAAQTQIPAGPAIASVAFGVFLLSQSLKVLLRTLTSA